MNKLTSLLAGGKNYVRLPGQLSRDQETDVNALAIRLAELKANALRPANT